MHLVAKAIRTEQGEETHAVVLALVVQVFIAAKTPPPSEKELHHATKDFDAQTFVSHLLEKRYSGKPCVGKR